MPEAWAALWNTRPQVLEEARKHESGVSHGNALVALGWVFFEATRSDLIIGLAGTAQRLGNEVCGS
jgi:hypothetical protein